MISGPFFELATTIGTASCDWRTSTLKKTRSGRHFRCRDESSRKYPLRLRGRQKGDCA
jgi:hypothetical protein